MWIQIDLRSPLPAYQQIKVKIKQAILKEELRQDQTLPSIREMAQNIRVNPNTVARSYRELEAEGVIMARQGVGYIVVVNPGEIRENFLQDIREQLMIPIRQMKRSGIEEEECIEVVKKCWKESS